MRKFILSAAFLTATVMATSASAATLTLFQTDDLNNSANTSDTPTTVGAGVSSSDLAFGPGLSGQTGWPDTLDAAGFFGNTDLAGAVANDDYLSVTVTPDSGNSVDYSNFHAVIGVNVGTAAGDNSLALLSSDDGFASTIATLEPVTPTNGALTSTTFDIPLSITSSSAVEFRLYYAKIGNRVGIGAPFNINPAEDSLRIDGTVTAIPEPSTLLLGLGAMLSTVSLRRRK